MKKDNMQALFDTMDHEQNDFRNWLLQQPPETILDHAYQYAAREDIIMAFSESDFELDQDQAGALLTCKSPLQTLLNDYTKLKSITTMWNTVFPKRYPLNGAIIFACNDLQMLAGQSVLI